MKTKFHTALLFDGNAHEAAKYYMSIFKNSKVVDKNAMAISFTLNGNPFIAINGPKSEFTWAMSIMVNCKTQKEIDNYWKKLTANGGKEGQCGWLTDKYGVSWQIVPENINKLYSGKDKVKSERAAQAMMKMKKLNIAELKKAYDGK